MNKPEPYRTGRQRWRAFLLAGALALPVAVPAQGTPQDADLAALRQQVEALRGALDRLDAQLRRMEQAPGQPPAAAPLAAPVAPTAAAAAPAAVAPLDAHERELLHEQARATDALQAWRQVQPGMGQDEVRRLLGEPQSMFSADPGRSGWRYKVAGAGAGTVLFDRSGKVISAMAPGQGLLRMY
jgi:hypothetical protein